MRFRGPYPGIPKLFCALEIIPGKMLRVARVCIPLLLGSESSNDISVISTG